MAKKVTQLDEAAVLTGSELLPVVQGGTSKKASSEAIAKLAKNLRNTVAPLVNTAGTVPVNHDLSDFFTLALAANVTAISFANMPGAGKGWTCYILITQGSPARTVAWPSSFKWVGAAPVVSTTNGAKDMLILTTFDNGTTFQARLDKAYA
jgi:hypothetical protein